MLVRVGRWARTWSASTNPWTNVYGLTRSLMATATALTLLFSRTSSLFRPGTGALDVPLCTGERSLGLFCVLPAKELDLACWLSVAILLLVASGWRPRVTGVLHWWVSFSLHANALVLDGGDNVAAVLTLLLLPVTLTDARRWHWQEAPNAPVDGTEELKRIVALVALWIIRLQVAGVYFHAAIGKFGVEEWTNGTALYYFLTSPSFGAAGWLSMLLWPILTNSILVTLLTWSVLVVEYLLSAGLLIPKRRRGLLLAVGIALHFGILVVHGLVSFSMTMFAALILYLRPVDAVFNLRPIPVWQRLWQRHGAVDAPPADTISVSAGGR